MSTPRERDWPRLLADRLRALFVPEPNSGCWLWLGKVNEHGYACIGARRGDRRGPYHNFFAHRLMYELVRGPIPGGLPLDHLCRVRSCINPHHLEAVPDRVNILRGEGLAALNTRKTVCSRGHLFDRIYTRPDGREQRCCARCRTITSRQRRAAHRQEASV